MTETYRTEELEKAQAALASARAAMEAAKVGSKKWRDAEEDLNFWQGRVAYLTVPTIQQPPRLYDAGNGRRVTVPED